MKVRWTQTSIRLRITPSELQLLACGWQVTEQFGPAPGAWRVTIVPASDVTDLTFTGGEVRLSLSAQDAERLLAPENEGVYFQTEGASALRYFIEKDFPCAHPRAADALEPETETFAAPDGFNTRKQAA